MNDVGMDDWGDTGQWRQFAASHPELKGVGTGRVGALGRLVLRLRRRCRALRRRRAAGLGNLGRKA